MQGPAPVEAVPNVSVTPELLNVVGPSDPPPVEDIPATTSVPTSSGPIFPVHKYEEDWYLPRPQRGKPASPDRLGYVNTQGNGVLATPVNGRRTSPFGMRMHPVLHIYKLHTGLDFAAPCGTPIGAAADGVVSFVGWAGGNGYMVGIRHGQINGYDVVTNYAHLSSAGVRVGDHVKRHQGIGRVGNTGYSTGCHLHFEVKANGQFTDPASWLSKDGVVVFAQDMPDYAAPSPSPPPSPSPSPSVSPSPDASPSLSPSVPTSPSAAPSTSGSPTTTPTGPQPSDPKPSDEPSPEPSASASPSPSPSPSKPKESPSGSEKPTEPAPTENEEPASTPTK
uniref:M23 family metallopeptidase n=1 Tax=Tessaracoccus timonensis TaxID=2161816 RepID=UPI001E5AC11A|nr:M23 family metallopeptidase [Tessaracoccus timonensis]